MKTERNQEIYRRFYENGESLRAIACDHKLSHTYVWLLTQRQRTPENMAMRQASVDKRRKDKTMTTQQYIKSQRRAMKMVEREMRQQEAIKLLRQRMPEREIAKRLGVSLGTVRALIAPYRASINADQLETFRVLREAGKTYAEIASTTGFSILTVRDWLNLTRRVAQEADEWIRQQQREKSEADAWLEEVEQQVA